MWLVFLFFIILLGITYSSIEVNLYNVSWVEKRFDFKVKLYIKIFGIFKILVFNTTRDGFVFFKNIKKFSSKKDLKKIYNDYLDILKKFNVKIDKINFDLKIGLLDVALTNLALVILSSIIPFVVKDRVKRENLKYKIVPDYNKFCFNLNGKISFSMKTLRFVKLYFKNIKQKNAHNKFKNYGVKESF